MYSYSKVHKHIAGEMKEPIIEIALCVLPFFIQFMNYDWGKLIVNCFFECLDTTESTAENDIKALAEHFFSRKCTIGSGGSHYYNVGNTFCENKQLVNILKHMTLTDRVMCRKLMGEYYPDFAKKWLIEKKTKLKKIKKIPCIGCGSQLKTRVSKHNPYCKECRRALFSIRGYVFCKGMNTLTDGEIKDFRQKINVPKVKNHGEKKRSKGRKRAGKRSIAARKKYRNFPEKVLESFLRHRNFSFHPPKLQYVHQDVKNLLKILVDEICHEAYAKHATHAWILKPDFFENIISKKITEKKSLVDFFDCFYEDSGIVDNRFEEIYNHLPFRLAKLCITYI